MTVKKTKQKPKRFLFVDGDQIAYTCAAMAEERYIRVVHKPTEIHKVFKNRTEFKARMAAKGKLITEDYQIEDIQEAESPAFCFKVIKQKIENLKKACQADIVETYVGCTNNFRMDLPVPLIKSKSSAESRYKGQRTEIRPLLLKDSHRYIQTSLGGKPADGYEVDDLLSIRAYEELGKGNISIIASFDKDTYQADGIWMYNFGHDKPELYLIPELGEELVQNLPGYKGTGLRFFCYQWLAGDPVDNYCGYRLAKEKFKIKAGPKSIAELLNQQKDVKSLLEAVVKTYKLWYPDNFKYTAWDLTEVESSWFDMMQLNFKLAWMKRSQDDQSDCRDLFKKYGVEYV